MAICESAYVNALLLLSATYSLRKIRVSWLVLIPFLHSTAVSFLIAIFSHPSINFPNLLRKSTDGHIPWWSSLIFSPYIYLQKTLIRTRTMRTNERSYTEVSEGIYVGYWPCDPTQVPPGNPAVIDCTCELPKSDYLQNLPYICIPIWDSRAPTVKHIQYAVKWAEDQHKKKRPIFIHCAFGHGRSVAITCAVLVTLHVAENVKSAHELIKNKRPAISVNVDQFRMLELWEKELWEKKL